LGQDGIQDGILRAVVTAPNADEIAVQVENKALSLRTASQAALADVGRGPAFRLVVPRGIEINGTEQFQNIETPG
jgi:arylamine N-acetyltransferase